MTGWLPSSPILSAAAPALAVPRQVGSAVCGGDSLAAQMTPCGGEQQKAAAEAVEWEREHGGMRDGGL